MAYLAVDLGRQLGEHSKIALELRPLDGCRAADVHLMHACGCSSVHQAVISGRKHGYKLGLSTMSDSVMSKLEDAEARITQLVRERDAAATDRDEFSAQLDRVTRERIAMMAERDAAVTRRDEYKAQLASVPKGGRFSFTR